ncbi:MAG: hypothetical protein ACR2G4_19220 [Pyrinomonadaceae bacterium]
MRIFTTPRSLTTLTLLIFSVLWCGFAPVSSLAQGSASERELEDKVPAHLPIKAKVKNLHNKKWLDDLEIEIRNTGDKPIYYLNFAVVLPEVRSENGNPTGFSLRYGNWGLVDPDKRPTPEDVSINPGESYVFKLPERSVKGWRGYKARSGQADPKKVVLIFNSLRFGDGTGFWTTGGVPVPNKKVSQNSCEKGRRENAAEATAVYRQLIRPPDTFRQSSFSFLPVSYLPASFFGTLKLTDSTVAGTTSPDVCCPGTSCSHLREVPNGYNCMCGPANWVESAPCSSMGTCGKVWTLDDYCYDDYGYYMGCPQFYVNPCDGWDGI